MEKAYKHVSERTSTGDYAVSGLFCGLQAGVMMAAVIVIYSLAAGLGFDYLGYFSTGAPIQPLLGLAGHLAVSAIYGMLYAVSRHVTRLDRVVWLPGWLAGLIFACGLWILAVLVVLPAAQSMFLSIPWVVFFSGHIVYGLVLGYRMTP